MGDGAGDVVSVRDMPFHSLCEHHLLPFWGTAHVAYLPRGHVLGLSKFPRLLQAVARRPQMQERLGHQYIPVLRESLYPRTYLPAVLTPSRYLSYSTMICQQIWRITCIALVAMVVLAARALPLTSSQTATSGQ